MFRFAAVVMERLVAANPPARSCIQDTVLCPADPAVRYLLGQAAQPRGALAQLIVVAAERPVHEYVRWIGRRPAASLPPGRIGIVDCFTDPCGWRAAWAAPPSPAAVVEAAAGGGSVRVTAATRDGRDGFDSVVAAVRRLHAASHGTAGAGESGGGGEAKKTLVLIDSASYLLLRTGVQDVMRLLHRLCALPATCVAFVLHTGRDPPPSAPPLPPRMPSPPDRAPPIPAARQTDAPASCCELSAALNSVLASNLTRARTPVPTRTHARARAHTRAPPTRPHHDLCRLAHASCLPVPRCH